MPAIRGIRSGVAQKNIGKKLSGDLCYFDEAGVDAEFNDAAQTGRRGAKLIPRLFLVADVLAASALRARHSKH
jgi:hypothetical protein